MAAVATPAVPGDHAAPFPLYLNLIERVEALYPGNYRAVKQFMSDFMYFEGSLEHGPPITIFPERRSFEASLRALLTALVSFHVDATAGDLEHMFVGLPLIGDAFAFYTVRLTAAIIATGSPEHGVNIVADFKRNLIPISRFAAFLYPLCRSPQYTPLRHGISQLIISTFMTLGLACHISGVPRYVFFTELQTVESWNFLGLLYYLLETSPGPAGSEEEISLCSALTVAETLAGPLCFADLQMRWLLRLKDDLHKVSRNKLDLSLAQLTALRAPAGQTVELSLRCWRGECASDPSTSVKRCKRVWYCSKQCMEMDWAPSHRALCSVLLNVSTALEQKREELVPYFVTM